MKHYDLGDDEVVLFKTDGARLSGEISDSTFVMVTNYNLVIVRTPELAEGECAVITDVYPIADIKIYKEDPQVKRKKGRVEVYLKGAELELEFIQPKEAAAFRTAVFDLITGKTSLKRGMEKVRGAIDDIDDALGVDTVGTIAQVTKAGLGSRIKGGAALAMDAVAKALSPKAKTDVPEKYLEGNDAERIEDKSSEKKLIKSK